MQRGDIIRYVDMTIAEGQNLQRGMNFNANKEYSIILMSVRPNAPYNDSFEDNGKIIIYEGHDIQSNHNKTSLPSKLVDQPEFTPSKALTENGKFIKAVKSFKANGSVSRRVKVYEKIRDGIWSYNGFFELFDAYKQSDGHRNVFKFKLKMLEDVECDHILSFDVSRLEKEHNRLIPTKVKVQVWKRDKGACIHCGSTINLHYDHVIPFSKGGSSFLPENIQILCATCNLKKHANIE